MTTLCSEPTRHARSAADRRRSGRPTQILRKDFAGLTGSGVRGASHENAERTEIRALALAALRMD